ncbi:histidine kinase [Halobacteriales archaeon QS_8_65_32]|nr:MAG: histidine kinase [Halobacteriales archaeon QS_8_65_32]
MVGYKGATVDLSGLLDRVDGTMETLTVYNFGGSDEVIEDLYDFFGQRLVMVAESNTQYGEPTGVAMLHDGERFLAAGPVEPAHRSLAFDPAAFSGESLESDGYPEILEHAATTAFTSYDKRRMILASREIETRAWQVGNGELYAGFRRLSVMRHQWDVYAKLARTGVAVHAYGAPDWTPPDAEADTMNFHGREDAEVKESWFVVFDGDGDDTHKAALVSEERDPGEFYGFWTYEPDLVNEVVAYFRGGRAPVSSSGADSAGTAD